MGTNAIQVTSIRVERGYSAQSSNPLKENETVKPQFNHQEWMNLQLAIDFYREGLIESSWTRLFMWAECKKVIRQARETSEKQKQQQKLFQQLGTLHRTRANLRNIIHDFYTVNKWPANNSLENACQVIDSLIQLNKVDMNNIK